jgi:hypothetical protein
MKKSSAQRRSTALPPGMIPAAKRRVAAAMQKRSVKYFALAY